jgi:pimeloyl-ACP methyl ester carboxylesterase
MVLAAPGPLLTPPPSSKWGDSCGHVLCSLIHVFSDSYFLTVVTSRVQDISSARLKWVDNCGHVPHLEQVDNCVTSRVL